MHLLCLRAVKALIAEYVFTFRGKPVGHCTTKAWKAALDRADIEDLRWHDVRHTSASWYVQCGTSLQELMGRGCSPYEMALGASRGRPSEERSGTDCCYKSSAVGNHARVEAT
jgi:hypothetical protein